MKSLRARKKFNGLIDRVSELNGFEIKLGEQFNIAEPVQQAFETKLGEKVDFLGMINSYPVLHQKGQKVGLSVNKSIAGRTDTENKDRTTRYIGDLTGNQYECVKTDFDTHISYSTLDTMSAFPDFQVRYTDVVLRQVARDRIKTGWHGTHAAENTDIAANPNLEDVNVGWLEQIRKNAPDRVMGIGSDGNPNGDQFRIGEGGDYPSLDAVVFDMVNSLPDSWHQDSDDLILILGRDLWVKHGMTVLTNSAVPTEQIALKTWFAEKSVGGLPAVRVPFFPVRGLLITSYDNLSVYYQEGALRRTIIDNPRRDRVEEYLSSNDAYVVEDYGKVGHMDSRAVLLPDGNGGWV